VFRSFFRSLENISFFSDYDLYTNYRDDPYGAGNGQGPPALQQQPQAVYPSSHRPYPSGSSSSNLAQYYGAQQRA
jgi:hypothetical protein